MNCPKCGARLEAETKSCKACGGTILTDAEKTTNDTKEENVQTETAKKHKEVKSRMADDAVKAAIGANAAQTVGRYGEANAYHVRGYRGGYTKQGQPQKGLKAISKSKINPQYKDNNISQQAGFSAENLEVAQVNARNAIERNPTRIARCNDVGRGNDQILDVVGIDANGSVILHGDMPASGAQMKFLNDPKKYGDYLAKDTANGSGWEKYRGKEMIIPKDQYDAAIKHNEEMAQNLRKQAEKLQASGKKDLASAENRKADIYEQANKDLKPAEITRKQAIDARMNPKIETAKQIGKNAAHSGAEQGAIAAFVTLVVSAAQNIPAVIRGEKDLEDAAKETGVAVAESAALGAGVGGMQALAGGFLQASKNNTLQCLGKSSLPGVIVSGTVQVAQSLHRYAKGEIDERELVEELGEKGCGMVAAGWGTAAGGTVGAAIGAVILPGVGAIPGAAIGGIIGAMAAYMTSSMIYGAAMQVFHEEDFSAMELDRITFFCQAAIREFDKQTKQLKAYTDRYFSERKVEIDQSFSSIDCALKSGNSELFTQSMSAIAMQFGRALQFENFEEFDSFMEDSSLKLIF
ncbi:MAG: zinc ribbon domain-containing protein [Ruthenibacterium sp.]